MTQRTIACTFKVKNILRKVFVWKLSTLSYMSLSMLSIFIFTFLSLGVPHKNIQFENNQQSVKNEDLIICSQNLANYGEAKQVKERLGKFNLFSFRQKEQALVLRFIKAKCDVIAVQEILTHSRQDGLKVLEKLANLLSITANRKFLAYVGESNDSSLRSGYLIASDAGKVVSLRSYNKVPLPKLMMGEKQRHFSRGPFALQLVSGRNRRQLITFLNFHFKSRSSRWNRDPSGLDFEIPRMEMAEALREIVKNNYAGKLVVMLGDRNDNFDAASAKILEGSLSLDNFRYGGNCRLSKSGLPLCQQDNNFPNKTEEFVSVLDNLRSQIQGTLSYKGKYYWLDEILLPQNLSFFAKQRSNVAKINDFTSGVVADQPEASDHSLVWVKLNW